MATILRYRHVSPLTPGRVRQTLIEEDTWESLKTPLDSRLSTAESDALERYADCEALLQGRARTADYCGDRVQSSRADMAPLADRVMPQLRQHARVKATLSPRTRAVLAMFTQQQLREPGALSDAQAGLALNPRSLRPASDWRSAVVAAANALAGREVAP